MANCMITFDIDWAPDWAVEHCKNKLERKGLKGVFFITHSSDIIQDLISSGHEVGIHPNLFPGSSHGDTFTEVFEHLLNVVPNASAMRTHGLYQSTAFFMNVAKHFPQIKIDFSLLTYRATKVEKTALPFDGGSIDRINYNWEDDIAFNDADFGWDCFRPWSNFHIFDFHPIHVALNSVDEIGYRQLKEQYFNAPLLRIEKKVVSGFRNPGTGAENYLDSVLASMQSSTTIKSMGY